MNYSIHWKHREAANQLHHLSMRYVGSFVEAAKGERVSLLEKDYPGLKDLRDLIDLVLAQRAEISALSKLLIDKKIFTVDEYTIQATSEMIWLTREKANQFGCTVTEAGLIYRNESERNN